MNVLKIQGDGSTTIILEVHDEYRIVTEDTTEGDCLHLRLDTGLPTNRFGDSCTTQAVCVNVIEDTVQLQSLYRKSYYAKIVGHFYLSQLTRLPAAQNTPSRSLEKQGAYKEIIT